MFKQISKPMHIGPQRIIILYEVEQVLELGRFFDERPQTKQDFLVIALSLDIEEKLQEHSIPFFSGRMYKKLVPDQLVIEDSIIHDFFEDPRWGEFQYRDISLLKVFQFMFRAYVQRVWYFGNIFISITKHHPAVKEFVLFTPSEIITSTFGYLAKREIYTVIDCAKTIAMQNDILVTIVPCSVSIHTIRSFVHSFLFFVRRALFSLLLKIWNGFMVVIRRPRTFRLVVSDYWRNIGTSIKELENTECIFLDRTEILHIPWRLLKKYRMRFMHIDQFLSSNKRKRAKESAKKFHDFWHKMRNTMKPVFVRDTYVFDGLLLCAIDDIFVHLEKILQEIEGTFAMYDKLYPHAILLRASVSGQTHFSILPLVAKEQSIPSIELQHGVEYLGPGSWSREHNAEYIVVYGPLIKDELITIGYSPQKIEEIGSPRFDLYSDAIQTVKKKNNQKEFTVLCITPDIRSFEIYDSYSAEHYFNTIAKALTSISDARVLIKLRGTPAGEVLFRSIIAREFSDISYDIAQYESLSNLYNRTDVVISCFSTAVLEAMQCGLPVIIPTLNPIDATVVNFHFSQYQKNHALVIVSSQEEFSKTLQKFAHSREVRDEFRTNALAFIKHNFLFDGSASQRFANFITKCMQSRF